jgi:probable F420-dependent oxidoreductase
MLPRIADMLAALGRFAMKVGIALGGSLAELGVLARRCEEAGFDSIWIAETGRTAFIQAAVAIQATERIVVGTSIALAFPRSPVITAMSARDLAELSGGRFVLGLGTQVKRVNEFRYATPFEHPAPKMTEVVDVCRQVWRAFGGEPIDHRGRFFTVTMPPFPGAGPPPAPIPIYLAGVNTMMLTLTGSRADGFLGHPFTSARYVSEVARPAIEQGATREGRSIDDVHIAQSVICSVGDTEAQALTGAKPQIAFYATTRTYKPVLDLHGFGDVIDPLRDAHARGDMDGMVSLITDDMARTYSVSGTPADARGQLERFEGLVDTLIINPPWIGPDATRSADRYERLIETFAPNR